MARWGHGVIQVDNEFIVVGGITTEWTLKKPTELCTLNGQSITCTTREPQLFKFSYFPELMLVP